MSSDVTDQFEFKKMLAVFPKGLGMANSTKIPGGNSALVMDAANKLRTHAVLFPYNPMDDDEVVEALAAQRAEGQRNGFLVGLATTVGTGAAVWGINELRKKFIEDRDDRAARKVAEARAFLETRGIAVPAVDAPVEQVEAIDDVDAVAGDVDLVHGAEPELGEVAQDDAVVIDLDERRAS